MARKLSACPRPEDVYRWPDEVQARLGVGRSIYDLVTIGGLKVHAFGRRRFVNGQAVIDALNACCAREHQRDNVGANPFFAKEKANDVSGI